MNRFEGKKVLFTVVGRYFVKEFLLLHHQRFHQNRETDFVWVEKIMNDEWKNKEKIGCRYVIYMYVIYIYVIKSLLNSKPLLRYLVHVIVYIKIS